MKRKLMSIAVAGTLLGAGTANAVFVNGEGSGQVLIYPYYTVEGGHDTYINLVNTSAKYKAVKVRFVEAMNSQEVLDFNLYMSPFDHWSAVVFADGEGASIRTGDTSCVVPNALSDGATVPFRNFGYLGDKGEDADGEPFDFTGLDRTREGYVEIIEMGELTETAIRGDDIIQDQEAVKHVRGVPGDCTVVSGHWNTGGKWAAEPSVDMAPPTGGLYGYGVLINVNEGTNATYDAVALADFVSVLDPSRGPIHFPPGTTQPSLENATPIAQVLDSGAPGGAAVVELFFSNPNRIDGLDAVSATLMHSQIQNDYVLEPSISAGTDWVVTFPTKKQHVNGVIDGSGDPAALAPFTNAWDRETATACEAIGLRFWDREEAERSPDPLDFSPPPPSPSAFALCHEANVLTINGSDVLAGSERVSQNLELPADFDNGWLEMDFAAQPSPNVTIGGAPRRLEGFESVGGASTGASVSFAGLPSVGFAVQKYVNGTLADGTLLSNYTGLVQHKNQRIISVAE